MVQPHPSPASSAEFLPRIVELAPHWIVIAPDTPGNGLSDPLPSMAVADRHPAHVHGLALDLPSCLPQASRLQAAHDGHDLPEALASRGVPVRSGADLLTESTPEPGGDPRPLTPARARCARPDLLRR